MAFFFNINFHELSINDKLYGSLYGHYMLENRKIITVCLSMSKIAYLSVSSHIIYNGTASRSAGSDISRRPRQSHRGPAQRWSPSRILGILLSSSLYLLSCLFVFFASHPCPHAGAHVLAEGGVEWEVTAVAAVVGHLEDGGWTPCRHGLAIEAD